MERNDGKKFENEFARFAVKNLKFDNYKMRTRVNGKDVKQHYEIDIHGEIINRKYIFLMYIGYLGIIIFFLTFFDFIPEIKECIEKYVTEFVPYTQNYPLFFFALISLVIGIYGKKKKVQHVLVECKNTKKKVNRSAISQLSDKVDEIRNNPNPKQWKPDKIIFVSSSGFDEDALIIAKKHNFICYIKSGRTFKKVKLK
jgi:hypothetical protein